MKSKSNKGIYNFLELFFGILFLLIGFLVFETKIFGVRGGYVEGKSAQIGGLVFMAFGVYRIFQAIRKLLKGAQNSVV